MTYREQLATYDELFEACEGLFHRACSEDLPFQCRLLSQEPEHEVFDSITLHRRENNITKHECIAAL